MSSSFDRTDHPRPPSAGNTKTLQPDRLDEWFPIDRQGELAGLLVQRLGLTRRRADCLVRLRAYLWLKEWLPGQPQSRPPLANTGRPSQPIACSQREAAALFYPDGQGSDRAAGLMLDKLASLGLIHKTFDGNLTQIEIAVIPELDLGLDLSLDQATRAVGVLDCVIDDFDPRNDAIPIGLLLAENYNWLNRNNEATPHRIAKILRHWAETYPNPLSPNPTEPGRHPGLRVLRRQSDQQPVGFYALYPVAAASEAKFFQAPSRGLHLSVQASEITADPFRSAPPGDRDCTALFIRSWAIAPAYLAHWAVPFVTDLQDRLRFLVHDFPALCDLYTLVIHPSYETLGRSLGFQKILVDPQLSVYWMYASLDRFLAIKPAVALAGWPN